MLQRVLGRDHEQRLGERMARSIDRDRSFLEGLEESRLRSGRRSVYLVDEDDVGEQRAGDELESLGGAVEDVGSGDIGREQIRGGLDPLERPPDRAGESARQHRLAYPGDVFDQDVATREQGGGCGFDYLSLAAD